MNAYFSIKKILDYNISESTDKKRKKYNDDDITLIKKLNDNFTNKNHLIDELKNNHKINISIKTINKILNDEY